MGDMWNMRVLMIDSRRNGAQLLVATGEELEGCEQTFGCGGKKKMKWLEKRV